MGARLAIRLLAALTVVGVWATSAPAQAPGGAFERLSPGDQKIARSLFDAQRRDLAPGSRLSLDQIAVKKSGDGWGVVFKDMKSSGLVTAKNLGQVVERGNRSRVATNGMVNRAQDHNAVSPSAAVHGPQSEPPRGVGSGIGAGASHGGGGRGR